MLIEINLHPTYQSLLSIKQTINQHMNGSIISQNDLVSIESKKKEKPSSYLHIVIFYKPSFNT